MDVFLMVSRHNLEHIQHESKETFFAKNVPKRGET